ncbi:glycosyltransferase [Marinobacter sp. 2_MG-2023]|uniref:glycosyltransferase n=1 Tax=Marinobacter sp. 2_MG-2023 TaxID=3062679 RepID=UPI0026E2C1E1|nr:glycosyltransferase [Marinobacter sp. 2_MG-2023]MDO6443707.1 glycosyltransferase [Marinobacter sp. 2_MG-2023]
MVDINKVAFLVNSLSGGGAERVIQTLSNSLVGKGFDIYLILLDDEDIRYDLDDRVKVLRLKTSFLSKGPLKILILPFQAAELSVVLRRIDVKNVISFLVRSNFVSVISGIFSNRKVVISERNYSKLQYNSKGFKGFVMNSLIKFLYKRADLILPISHGIECSLISDYGLDSRKIKVIHNPQDLKAIKELSVQSGNDDFFIKNNGFFYVTVGRLVDQKDHVTLINAFKRVQEVRSDAKLIIIGDGSLKSYLKDSVDKLKLKDHVFFLGFVNNPFFYLNNSDVFVFSSKFEGFGNVLVEAMACGLPVISTDCLSGPSEILRDGEYGILVEVGNVNEMSNSMLSLLDNKKYDYYRGKSLARSLDFDVDIVELKYLSVFEN